MRLKHSQLCVAIFLVPVILAHQTVLSTELGRPPKPIARDENRQWDLTFSGPLAFEHMKYAKCLADDNIKFDMAVLGFPFDNKVTYRPGARFGPFAIRSGSRNQDKNAYSFSWGASAYDGMEVIDCGDVPVNPYDTDCAINQAHLAYWTLLTRGLPENSTSAHHKHPRILSLGGDHTIALPILRALNEVYGQKITVIHFDSHPDTWTPGSITEIPTPTTTSRLTHGTFFDRAFNESLMTENCIHAGLRCKLLPDDLEHDKEIGFTYIPAWYMDEWGADRIASEIRKTVNKSGPDTPIYLSLDIDVLDPGIAPGTGTPEAGGWTMRELKRILTGLAGLNIVGADIVEVSPPFDHAELTSIAAAELGRDLFYLLRGDIQEATPFRPLGSF